MVRGGDSYYGLLQAFADALKLLLKEYVAPTQSNIILFFLGALWSRISLLCQQLSNSGNTLKLLVPNDGLKAIRGWNNYSCMVISQNIIETEIGNHGSKSIAARLCGRELLNYKSAIVKEQWVDGSWQDVTSHPCLRCILTGFERNYQNRILSKQTNIQIKRFFFFI